MTYCQHDNSTRFWISGPQNIRCPLRGLFPSGSESDVVRRWSRQSEAVAVGLLEEDTWVRLGAGHRMLLDQEHLSLLCWFSRDSEQGRYFPHSDHELGEAGLGCTRLWDCP